MGLPPNSFDKMSMYEVSSTYAELKKIDEQENGGPPMTQARMDELKERWASLNLTDVKV